MSDVQKRNSTDTSLRKGELPLSPGNSGKEGERANGAKDLGKEKGGIRFRQDGAEYAGKEKDSGESTCCGQDGLCMMDLGVLELGVPAVFWRFGSGVTRKKGS